MEKFNGQFGLLVAYLLPGFVGLGGVALLIPSVATWLSSVASDAGIGPPIYTVLAAIAMGMILSCFRWLLIDGLFSLFGIRAPTWNAAKLSERLSTLSFLVENHYRYAQFYSNMVMAILWTYLIHRFIGSSTHLSPLTDLGIGVLCLVLLLGAKDALSKYYDRTRILMESSSARSTVTSAAPVSAGASRPKPPSPGTA